MRFESVTAHAFGPLRGETLRLAPGMTVVHGPNEAGKSSWHAAVYAGLCGMRRGKGGARKDEAAFAQRHRPWRGDAWDVGAVIALDDGRRIELRHDLLGKVDCRATDLVLGRDCSAEIVHEGAPDGARWLGLDRRSFLATACVRQADLLSVLDDADLLQEHLQRAATAPGADATAAGAIQVIASFRATRIGSARVGSQKPLRLAQEGVALARRELERAAVQHAEYLELVERADRLREAASLAERSALTFRAAQADRDARRARERRDRARELAARRPSPPDDTVEETDAVDDLRTRLAAAQRRAELRAQARPSLALLVLGTIALALGLLLAVAVQAAIGAGVFLVGLLILAFLAFSGRRPRPSDAEDDVKRLAEELAHASGAAARRSAERATARAEWDELQRLLGDGSVEALDAEARQREEALSRLAAQTDVGMAAALALDEDVDARAEQLQGEADAAREAWARARGQAEQRLASMPSVAEAEERLAAAEAELVHLRRLDATLETTRQFLERAQERVHRDVAGVLNGALATWLPRVTAGAYVDARVDPLTLRVQVADPSGAWYPAPLLSHGTAEQVYLLLRVAMAQHLAKGEVCPLVLDDVTVHADAERERAVLETLLALSQERQVILFSQEAAVLAWAETHLQKPRHALVHLSAARPGSGDGAGVPW